MIANMVPMKGVDKAIQYAIMCSVGREVSDQHGFRKLTVTFQLKGI